MATILTDKIVTARKQYQCFYCGTSIPVHTRHVYRSGVEYSDFWDMRAHQECDAWAVKNWHRDDEWEDHTPSDWEGPVPLSVEAKKK